MNKIVAAYAYDPNGNGISDCDIKKLTHLNIAFGKIKNDAKIHVDHLELIKNVKKYRELNPDLKIILSIGSGEPEAFSLTASTEEGRKSVASSCLEIMQKYDLDGTDYDWEYPCCPSNGIAYCKEDKENFTALMKTMRETFDSDKSKHYLLTIAAGAGDYYLDFTEMDKVQEYLDYVFLMTYDLRCGFHSLTGHHTNLYRATGDIFRTSCKDTVDMFEKAGVPRSKMCLGVAFYSRQWFKVPNRNNGFLQFVDNYGGYGPDFSELEEEYIGKNGFTRYFDDECKAPYLYNGERFISYDDEESIAHKCEYIKSVDIAGVFCWEYYGDKSGKLLDSMYKGMK